MMNNEIKPGKLRNLKESAEKNNLTDNGLNKEMRKNVLNFLSNWSKIMVIFVVCQ